MLHSDNLPVDPLCPLSCLYWLYDTRKHTDPRTSGYIGVCKSGLDRRLNQHKQAAASGSKLPVHSAIRKYGDFLGAKVLLVADPELCLLTEYMYRPKPNMRGTLNIAMGGQASPTTGTTLSVETRKKISEANSGANSVWWGQEAYAGAACTDVNSNGRRIKPYVRGAMFRGNS